MSHYKSRGAFSILLDSSLAQDFTEETKFHQLNNETQETASTMKHGEQPHVVRGKVRTGVESSGQ